MDNEIKSTVENNFKYHEADETQNMKYEDIRSAAKKILPT